MSRGVECKAPGCFNGPAPHTTQEGCGPRFLRPPTTGIEQELIRLGDPDFKKLDNWFSYHAPTEEQKVAYEQIRETAHMLARVICIHCPPSADRTVALRKLREAVMTANASIACDGK